MAFSPAPPTHPGGVLLMTRSLQGRRVLITGAPSGIGRATAQQLAALGARLVLAARSADKLESLAASLPNSREDILVVPTDVTKEADRQNVLDRAALQFGGLDVLINNAGIASWDHF